MTTYQKFAKRLINNKARYNLGMKHYHFHMWSDSITLKNSVKDFPQVNLAVFSSCSLVIRCRTMPVAGASVFRAYESMLRDYTESTKTNYVRKYALIDSVNDKPEHARELASHLKG